jgi:hypothetical protein
MTIIFNGLTEPDNPLEGALLKAPSVAAVESAVTEGLDFDWEGEVKAAIRAWYGDRDESSIFMIAGRVRASFARMLNDREWFDEEWIEETIETTTYDVIETTYTETGEVFESKVVRQETEDKVVHTREYTVRVMRESRFRHFGSLRRRHIQTLRSRGVRCHGDCISPKDAKKLKCKPSHHPECAIGISVEGNSDRWRKIAGMHSKFSAFGCCGLERPEKRCECYLCEEGRINWAILIKAVKFHAEQQWYGTSEQHNETMEGRRKAIYDKYKGAQAEAHAKAIKKKKAAPKPVNRGARVDAILKLIKMERKS